MEVEKLELYEDIVNPFFPVEQSSLDKESPETVPISTKELDEVKEQNSKLRMQNVALKKNISCLYKTARLEIERKNSMIKDLRERLDVLESDAQIGAQMIYQQYMVSYYTSGQVDALTAMRPYLLQPLEDIDYITNNSIGERYPHPDNANCNGDANVSDASGNLGTSNQEDSKSLASSFDEAPLVKAHVEKCLKIDSETSRTACESKRYGFRTKHDAGGNRVNGMDIVVSGRDVGVNIANGDDLVYDSEDSTTWNAKSDLNDFMATITCGQKSHSGTSSETARQSIHSADCEVKRKCNNLSRSVNENEMVLHDQLRGKDLRGKMSDKKRHEHQHRHKTSRDHHHNHTPHHKSRSRHHHCKSCYLEKDRSDCSRRSRSKHGLGHPRMSYSISPNGSVTPKSKHRKIDRNNGSVNLKSRRMITPTKSHHRRESIQSLQDQEDSPFSLHSEITPRSQHREVTPRSLHRELSPQSCHRGSSPGALENPSSRKQPRVVSHRSMHRAATPRSQCKAVNPKVQREMSPVPPPRTTTLRSQHRELSPRSQCRARIHKSGSRKMLSRSQHRMSQHREVSPRSHSRISQHRTVSPGSHSRMSQHREVGPGSHSRMSQHREVSPGSLFRMSQHREVSPGSLSRMSPHRMVSPRSQHKTVKPRHRELSPRSHHISVSPRSQHRELSPRPQHRELSPRSLQQSPSRLQCRQSREFTRKKTSMSPHSRQRRPSHHIHKKHHTIDDMKCGRSQRTLCSPNRSRSNSKSVLNQDQNSFNFPVQDSALQKCDDNSSDVTLGSLEDLCTTIEFDNFLEEPRSKDLPCSSIIDVCQSHKDNLKSCFLRSDSCSLLSLSDSEDDDQVFENCTEKQTMVVGDTAPSNPAVTTAVQFEDELNGDQRSFVSDTLCVGDCVGDAGLQLSSAGDHSFQGDSVFNTSTHISLGAQMLDLSGLHSLDLLCLHSLDLSGPHNLDNSSSHNSNHSGSLNLDFSGSQNLDLSGSQNLDLSGSQNLDLSGPNNLEHVGPHNLDLSGPHNLDLSGPHDVKYSGPHNLDLSGPHSLDHTGIHNLNFSVSKNVLNSSSVQMQDSSFQYALNSFRDNLDSSRADNLESSGVHNLDSSGAHNLDSSCAHNLDSSHAHNLESSGAHNLDSSGVHNLDSSVVHNLDSSSAHNLDSSVVHNLESSGAHNLDSSGVHNMDSSGAHNLDSSVVHNLESSGAHNLDSSGAHNLDSSGAHNLDSSGAHNLDSSGAHNLDSSCAHNLDSSGAHNLDSSGAHNLDSSGTHNLDSSVVHNLDSSGTHNLDSSGVHNLDSSGAHNLDSSSAHDLDSSRAHNLDSSCAYNLDSSGAYNLGSHNMDSYGAQMLQGVTSPTTPSHKLDSSSATQLDSTLTSSTNIHSRTSQPDISSSFDQLHSQGNQAHHYSDSSGSSSDSGQWSSSVTTPSHQLDPPNAHSQDVDFPAILDSPKATSGELLEITENSTVFKEWGSPVSRYMNSLISPQPLDSADIYSDSVQWGSPGTPDHQLSAPGSPTGLADSPSTAIASPNVCSNSSGNHTISTASNTYLSHASLYAVTVLDSSDNYNLLINQQGHLDNSHGRPSPISTGIQESHIPPTTDSDSSESEQSMEEGEITDSTSDSNDGGNELINTLHSLQSNVRLDTCISTVECDNPEKHTSNDHSPSHNPPSREHHHYRRHSGAACPHDKQIVNDHQHPTHSSRKESRHDNGHVSGHKERCRKQDSSRLHSRPTATHSSRKESRYGKGYTSGYHQEESRQQVRPRGHTSGHHQEESRQQNRSRTPHRHHHCPRDISSVTRKPCVRSRTRISN